METEAEAYRRMEATLYPPLSNPTIGDTYVTHRRCRCLLCEALPCKWQLP